MRGSALAAEGQNCTDLHHSRTTEGAAAASSLRTSAEHNAVFATEWRLWYSLVCGALRYNAPSALCLMVRLTFEIHRGGKVGPYGCRCV